MIDDNDGDRAGGDPPDREYQVGYGRPPRHTRFKQGNPGRPKGATKRPADFSEQLRRELMKPTRALKDGRVIERSTPQLLAQRLKVMLVQGKAREIEIAMRLIKQHAPEMLKQAEHEFHVIYHDADPDDQRPQDRGADE